VETFREAGEKFDGNFAMPALRLENAGDGDELFDYSRISSV
jgi:hypothetical protein